MLPTASRPALIQSRCSVHRYVCEEGSIEASITSSILLRPWPAVIAGPPRASSSDPLSAPRIVSARIRKRLSVGETPMALVPSVPVYMWHDSSGSWTLCVNFVETTPRVLTVSRRVYFGVDVRSHSRPVTHCLRRNDRRELPGPGLLSRIVRPGYAVY